MRKEITEPSGSFDLSNYWCCLAEPSILVKLIINEGTELRLNLLTIITIVGFAAKVRQQYVTYSISKAAETVEIVNEINQRWAYSSKNGFYLQVYAQLS